MCYHLFFLPLHWLLELTFVNIETIRVAKYPPQLEH